MLIKTDLRSPELRIPRVQPVLGVRNDEPINLSPFESLLISGSSGAGKSTTVTALLEQMRDLGFQFCVVDPEGDYAELPDAVVIGDVKQEPRLSEVKALLAKPDVSVVVNLLAIDPTERPRYLAKFLPEISRLRAEIGRPHWIVIDEVHHCLPGKMGSCARDAAAGVACGDRSYGSSRGGLARFPGLISTVVGVGEGSLAAIAQFCKAIGREEPKIAPGELGPDQVHLWTRAGAVDAITIAKPKERQKRHARVPGGDQGCRIGVRSSRRRSRRVADAAGQPLTHKGND